MSRFREYSKPVFFGLLPLIAVMLAMGPRASASSGCPLSNPRYKSLSEAVANLAAKVKLPSSCAAKQESMQQALTALSTSADQLLALSDGETQESVKKNKEAAVKAAASLNSINTLLKDDCGKAMLTSWDFLNAFVDTINAVTPYVLIFGTPAAAPWATGTLAAGAAIKTVVQYFEKTSVNMDLPDQRRAFVESACGFYSMNETVRSLIQAQQSEQTELQKSWLKAKEELEALQKAPPAAPSGAMFRLLSETLQETEELKALRTSVEAVKDMGFTCFVIAQKIQEKAFGQAGERLRKVLEGDSSPTARNDAALVTYFESRLNDATLYDDRKPMECASRATLWLNTLDQIIARTLTRAEPLIKDRPEVVAYRRWEEQVTKKKKEVADYKLREKFLLELVTSGASIDTSEILTTLGEVRDILFDGRGWGRDGLAQSWVKFKLRQSEASINSFDKQQKNVLRSRSLPQTPGAIADACAQAEQAKNTWYAADVHVRAAREFCIAFDSTINRYDFKAIQKNCFGRGEATVHEQRERVDKLRDEAAKISELMNRLGCRKPAPLSVSF